MLLQARSIALLALLLATAACSAEEESGRFEIAVHYANDSLAVFEGRSADWHVLGPEQVGNYRVARYFLNGVMFIEQGLPLDQDCPAPATLPIAAGIEVARALPVWTPEPADRATFFTADSGSVVILSVQGGTVRGSIGARLEGSNPVGQPVLYPARVTGTFELPEKARFGARITCSR